MTIFLSRCQTLLTVVAAVITVLSCRHPSAVLMSVEAFTITHTSAPYKQQLPTKTTKPLNAQLSSNNQNSNMFSSPNKKKKTFSHKWQLSLSASSVDNTSFDEQTIPPDNDEMSNEDKELLKTVTKTKLQNLCIKLNLPADGTKSNLLTRLRTHAQVMVMKEQERKKRLKRSIERGMDDDEESNGKARHEILKTGDVVKNKEEEEDDDDAMDGFFYFDVGENSRSETNTTKAKKQSARISKSNEEKSSNDSSSSNTAQNSNKNKSHDTESRVNRLNLRNSQNRITAPMPAADVKPNKDGERVVTIFSSTAKNDLTSTTTSMDPSTVGSQGGGRMRSSDGSTTANPQNTLLGGPFGESDSTQRKRKRNLSQASQEEKDAAMDAINELVYGLLAMTGAPRFQNQDDEEGIGFSLDVPTNTADFGFVGFDPSRVPTEMLTSNSKTLRSFDGEPLQNVIHDYEMRAIGYDGKNGDDRERGGGHYAEVRKVSTFLRGFVKAEIRNTCRSTIQILLGTLVKNDVEGLDDLLLQINRGGDDDDDDHDYEGNMMLNDSLLSYLDDTIRQQEMKVDSIVHDDNNKQSSLHGASASAAIGREKPSLGTADVDDEDDDVIDNLWNTTINEQGEVIESIDPKDPIVKQTLVEYQMKQNSNYYEASTAPATNPSNSPEQKLLMLLKLIKDRIQTEAMFNPNDEKGRNLRILAYCLHATDDTLKRENILRKHLGSSLERLDSFIELLQSSIDYAESTSHQLQPSKSKPLNVPLLKNILKSVQSIKKQVTGGDLDNDALSGALENPYHS